MMKNKFWISGVFFTLLLLTGIWSFRVYTTFSDVSTTEETSTEDFEEPIVKYGLNLNDFVVMNHVVKKNELFSDIFSQYNVTARAINYLIEESKSIFNLRKIKAGNCFTVLCEKQDGLLVPKKIIYEESKVNYVVFNVEDSLYIYRGENELVQRTREVSGVIRSSLYQTLEENKIDPALAIRLSEVFAWSIDFYKIQNGDKFKVIYTEYVVDGEPVSIGDISAVLFNSSGTDYYAFYYAKDEAHEGDYYDEKGNNMKKQFLKSPVKFSRISSKFSLKRFHPVTKRWKAHLGTDYAAPHGTPIIATADGVVEEAQYKSNNGNYVKIRHNGQYKTQYLHMSKIAKGVSRGARVKQGEVIGYVGSTGLATGPHVCYRFWKDGAQVDPMKQKLGYTEPLPAKYKSDFLAKTAPVKSRLDAISYEEHNIANQQATAQAENTSQATAEMVRRFF